jgi:DNA-directed RNA polymerase subunit delta
VRCYKFEPKIEFNFFKTIVKYFKFQGFMAKKQSKPKVVKDFDKLPKDIQAAIKAEYPNGFSHKLISYTTPKGEKVLALPFDGDTFDYLVRVTIMESRNIGREDDDFEDDVKPIRDDLDLDGLDLDGLKEEDDVSTDDEEDDYQPRSRRRRDDDDDDDDY